MTSTNATVQTVDQFVSRHGIKMIALKAHNPGTGTAADKAARHWSCKLSVPADRTGGMIVPYFQGSAHTALPTAADVLDCLASDISGLDNAGGFYHWCGEYGFDTDSRKATDIYETILRQSRELRALLGADGLAELMATDRL